MQLSEITEISHILYPVSLSGNTLQNYRTLSKPINTDTIYWHSVLLAILHVCVCVCVCVRARAQFHAILSQM